MAVDPGFTETLRTQISEALASMWIEERTGIDADWVEGGGSYYPVVTDPLPMPDDCMDALIRILMPMLQARAGRAPDRPSYIVWREPPTVALLPEAYRAQASFFLTPSNVIANTMTRKAPPDAA